MTRKSEVIGNLIELSRWRKQLRLGRRVGRTDLALDAIDNCFACLAAAMKAAISPRRPR